MCKIELLIMGPIVALLLLSTFSSPFPMALLQAMFGDLHGQRHPIRIIVIKKLAYAAMLQSSRLILKMGYSQTSHNPWCSNVIPRDKRDPGVSLTS